MRVAQVLFSGLGGHGSVAFSLVRGDRQRTHEHALVFYGVTPLARGYADSCAELGIEHAVILKRQGLDLASWGHVVGALRRMRPDAVLLHSMNLIAPVAAWARLTGTPIIAVDHLSNAVKRTKDWAFTALALSAAHRCVFLTTEFAEEVRRRLGALYRAAHVRIIPNGIDVDVFSPPLETRDNELLRVGMHARFAASKDYATLVRAVAAMPDDGRLSLAGDGETFGVVRALVETLGVSNRVEMKGMLPERELPKFLRALDVYVLSSSGETMSTSVMQAMAVGLPVLASDVAGLRSMVRSNVDGELFPLGDVPALVAALERLRDPRIRRRMSERAREKAVEEWSHVRMYERYDRMLAQLAATTVRKTFA